MSELTTNQKCSKDADAIDTSIDDMEEWISYCVEVVRTEGVADMHAGQKTGGVQKRLNQVDCDRPDVRGIPLPRKKYAGKRDVAIKIKVKVEGYVTDAIDVRTYHESPGSEVSSQDLFLLYLSQFQIRSFASQKVPHSRICSMIDY